MSGHTDAQLMLATQIAYLNINPKGGAPVNVKKYVEKNYERLLKKQADGTITASEKGQLNTMDNILNNMAKNPDYGNLGWENWTVVDSCDHNSGFDGSGMYASVIDTGDGSAIIGFRGSENYDAEQIVKDWGAADIALLNSRQTMQQADAKAYIERVYKKYGDRYESFDLAGHSLGGNLAAHATITAPYGMRGKINRCASFDGPGFSDEYIMAHGAQIAMMSDKIYHYNWSAVGALLFPLPGSHYITADADTPGNGSLKDMFLRHATSNVNFENGCIKEGERDWLANTLDAASKTIELAATSYLSIQLGILNGLINWGAEAIHSIGDWISSMVRRRDSAAPAEFYIRPDAAYAAAERFQRFEGEVYTIAEEVDRIIDGMAYHSLSGIAFRMKFHAMSRRIRSDAAAASRMAGAVSACADVYLRSDREAANRLTV